MGSDELSRDAHSRSEFFPRAAHPARRRRWRLWVGIGVLLTAVPTLALIWGRYHADSQLTAFVAELDRADPGWRLPEIEAGRRMVPDEDNSALQVLRVFQQLNATRFANRIGKDNPLEQPSESPVRLSEPQDAWLGELLRANDAASTEASKLQRMPDGRFPIKYADSYINTLCPHYEAVRWVTHFLELEASFHAEHQDTTRAAAAWHCLIHAQRSLGDEPMMLSQFIRIGCRNVAIASLERLLAQGLYSDATLAALQERLRVEQADNSLLWAARGERGGWHHFHENWRARKFSLAELTNPGASSWDKWRADFVVSPSRAEIQQVQLWAMTEQISICKLPAHQRVDALKAFYRALDNPRKYPVISILFTPNLTKLAASQQSSLACLRSAELAVAAERYRLTHRHWPETLEALVAAQLVSGPREDPYDGQTLRCKVRGDGFVVYALGPNQSDDGGNLERTAPDGSPDVGFRLWDLDQRRQPYRPPPAGDK